MHNSCLSKEMQISLVPIAISVRYRAAKVEPNAESPKAWNVMSISVGGSLAGGKIAGKTGNRIFGAKQSALALQ